MVFTSLGQPFVVERLVHFRQFAHYSLRYLRQLKMPGGQLTGVEIHKTGFDLPGPRLPPTTLFRSMQ
ncbi:hypothetical protein [Erwinia tracheiphila]|uniref:hypothetical protein n=1 Tax=Erwinia tracheiphila TaxID=65700 RepID=UPI001FD7A951|nr:hypothetical protein [Erwinia tracheiphila]